MAPSCKLKVTPIEEHIALGASSIEVRYTDVTGREFATIEQVASYLAEGAYFPEDADKYCQRAEESSRGGSMRKCVIIDGIGEETYLDLRRQWQRKYEASTKA